MGVRTRRETMPSGTREPGFVFASTHRRHPIFYLSYILNRGWLSTTKTLPPLDPSDTKYLHLSHLDSHSDSESDLDRAESYEQRYNFRFEEADGGAIKGYS